MLIYPHPTHTTRKLHTQDVLNASGGIHMYAEICDNSIPRY